MPIRVLNQNTAAVLARVEKGETVEITNRGKTVARIVPAGGGELDDWIESGQAIPATISGPIPMPRHKAAPGADAGALLSELRDDERW